MPPVLISDTIEDLFPQQRSEGKHISSAIHVVMRRLYPDRFKDTPIDMVRATIGNAMEHAIADALQRKYPGRFIRLSELEFEDHYGNADLFDIEEDAVTEVKCTWASSRRAAEDGPEDEWFIRYWWQGKAYAKMLGVTKVRLIIVFIVGDWKKGPPRCFQWQWNFTQEEIDENWEMIKAYTVDEAGQHGRKPVKRGGKRAGS